MNGFWLALLLGRWSMVTGWRDLFTSVPNRNKREFVSVDARLDDFKNETRSYEMLSRDSGKAMDDSVTPSVVTPISPTHARSPLGSPMQNDYAYPSKEGRRTPDYFGNTARYHAPARSFSSPRPPQTVTWDARETYARAQSPHAEHDRYVNPLGMNRI
jgi:hypothetical protein